MVTCKYCAESIKPQALVCAHCRRVTRLGFSRRANIAMALFVALTLGGVLTTLLVSNVDHAADLNRARTWCSAFGHSALFDGPAEECIRMRLAEQSPNGNIEKDLALAVSELPQKEAERAAANATKRRWELARANCKKNLPANASEERYDACILADVRAH
jgi:hypothetical protein